MTDAAYTLPDAHPLLVVGADVRSLTRRYGDTDKALGGAYLSTDVDHDTGAIVYTTVDTHAGRPEWHQLDETDVDWGVYSGLVRTDVIRDRLTVIAKDLARLSGRGTWRHTAALVRLQGTLA